MLLFQYNLYSKSAIFLSFGGTSYLGFRFWQFYHDWKTSSISQSYPRNTAAVLINHLE